MMKTKYKIKIAGIIFRFVKFFYKYFFRKKDIRNLYLKRNNINWKLDLTEGIDFSIFLFGNFEKSLNSLNKLLSSSQELVFIDIGANIGSTTINLAKQFRYSKIFAIEPTFYAYNKLLLNISLNHDLKKQIVPVNALISNRIINNNIYSSWKINNSMTENVHKHHLGSPKTFCDEFISLDDFVEKFKIKNIDFIKIDVDGNEKFVLESAIKSLEKFKPIIFFELAPYLYKENNYEFDDLYNIFKNLNYNFYNSKLKKIKNIKNYVSNIKEGSCENVYLF